MLREAEFRETFDGGGEYAADGESRLVGSFLEFATEDVSDGANKVDGEVAAVVGAAVAGEKPLKLIDDKVTNVGVVEMSRDETCELRQVTVSRRSTVNVVNHVVERRLLLLFEGLQKALWECALVEVADESTAKNSSAAFVAENVAEAWRLSRKTLSIVDGAAATRAKDGDDARLVAAKGVGGTKEVAGYTDGSCVEHTSNEALHSLYLIGTAACAVEMNMSNAGRRFDVC